MTNPNPKSGLRKSMDHNAEIGYFTTVPYQRSFIAKNLFSPVYFICFNSNFILIREYKIGLSCLLNSSFQPLQGGANCVDLE